MSILALVSLVFGLVVAVIGVLGFTERLRRNRFVGVRTTATLRDDATFRVANKVAGLPAVVGGAVGVVGGVLALTVASGSAATVISVLAVIGAGVMAAAGGVAGHRAAEAMPEPEPDLPAGCKGCQCGGCDLAGLKKASVGSDIAGVGGE